MPQTSDQHNRCQGSHNGGQCPNIPVEGSDYCVVHGGPAAAHAAKVQALKNYALTEWRYRQELNDKIGSDDLKSLRDEIGILRVLLERQLLSCRSDVDLITYSGAISDLVTKIERTVVSCHKLEASMGEHLDKAALLAFAGRFINLVADHVTDPTTLNNIADAIPDLL